MGSRRYMRGAGGGTVIIIILFVLLVGIIAVRLGPVHMQYMTVRSVVQDVAQTPGAAQRPQRQLLDEIERRFTINGIYDNVGRDDFSFEDAAGNKFLVLKYEVRRPFFANLDLVARFERRDQLER